MVMCRGITDEHGRPILDPAEVPWRYVKSATMKPVTADYRKEIERRSLLSYAKDQQSTTISVLPWVAPRPGAWKLDRLLKWLDDNPITAADDVAFLKATVEYKRQNAVEAFDAAKAEKELLERNWTGKYPYLRLIHSIVDSDEIKKAFLHRNDIDTTRMTVENRNSVDKRSKTVWELVALKWNDADYIPVTEELPELHSDFCVDETIHHNLVSDMALATPEKCQGKFSGMMVELGRVIKNWERSGQGDGGIEEDDDDSEASSSEELELTVGEKLAVPPGSLKNRERGALDTRASFVTYSQSYLLYLWHMLDKHDLLGSSLNQLDDSVAASNGGSGVPSVVMRRRENSVGVSTNSLPGSKAEESITLLYESLEGLGKVTAKAARMDVEERGKSRVLEQILYLEKAVDNLKDKKRTLAVEMLQNKKSKPMVDLLKEQKDEVEEEIRLKTQRLRRLVDGVPIEDDMIATPQRHNRTPPK